MLFEQYAPVKCWKTKSAAQNDQNMISNYKLLRSHDKIYHIKDIDLFQVSCQNMENFCEPC